MAAGSSARAAGEPDARPSLSSLMRSDLRDRSYSYLILSYSAADQLVLSWNLLDVIHDDDVKRDVFRLHEFKPDLFFQCHKNVRQAAAIAGGSRWRAGRRSIRHRHIGAQATAALT